jgi:adenylate cyclase
MIDLSMGSAHVRRRMDHIVHKVLRFDRFVLDLTRGCLRTGEQEIDLRPKAFQLLTYLAVNAGRLVPKQELLDAVWPNVVVSDESLVQSIRQLRAKLGDGDHCLIKTIARRGYMLDVAIATQDIPAVGLPRTARTTGGNHSTSPLALPSISMVGTSPGSLLPLPDGPSIAVLPFTNMSGDPKQEYLADGISDDIITELSRFSELFVIARQVGRELGVGYVIEGSIRRASDRVRITAQLIDARSGAHRWADHYDRKLDDIFAFQDEVARTIVAILAAHVSKAEATHALLKPPSSWQAHDYFLRGADTYNSFLATFLPEGLYEARHLFEGSLSLDPGYARAYAALSNTYTTAFGQPVCRDYLDPIAIERAYELAAKAVQLDSNLPLAHAKLGIALAYRAPPDEAIAAFERAIALNPNFTDWRFAIPLVFGGHFTRAIEVAEAHMRVDPFYPPLVQVISGFARYMLDQCSDALPLLREALLRAPSARFGRVALAAAYVRLGRLGEARAEAAEVLRIEPTYTIDRAERTLRRFSSPEHAEKYFGDLRKAGLPQR